MSGLRPASAIFGRGAQYPGYLLSVGVKAGRGEQWVHYSRSWMCFQAE